jgi:hypothetical protein
MASTYSTNLKIELIGTGEQAGTWGTTTNTNLGTALEQAVVGKADVTMSSTTITLTLTNANTAQNARAIYLNLTGSPGGAAVLEVPAIQKPYIVKNGSDQQVTIKVSGQTGVAIPTGKTALVYNNGTDVVTAVDFIPEIATTTVDTTNIEVTNIKAKDGSAAVVITDSTGAVAVSTALTANGGVVFNDAGADVDFRVEGDTDANLLFVDASTDRVGIGTSSPTTKLQVDGPADIGGETNNVGIFGSSSTNAGIIGTTANQQLNIFGNGTGPIVFQTGGAFLNGLDVLGTERMRIDSSGNVGIGTSSPAVKLNVSGVGGISAEGSDSFTVNKVVEAGQASMYGDANNTHFSHNVYYDGDWKSASNANHGQLIFDSSGNFKIRYEGPSVGGTAITWDDLVTVTSAGAVQIANGNLVFSTNGTGIDFSASAGGGATSSILDDYEEGTWTPTVTDGTNAASGYGSIREGRYVKIGNRVFIWVAVAKNGSVGMTGANSARITGLPFTNRTVTDGWYTPLVCGFYEITLPTGNGFFGNVSSNSTVIFIRSNVSGSAPGDLTVSQWGDGLNNVVMVSGFYEVA